MRRAWVVVPAVVALLLLGLSFESGRRAERSDPCSPLLASHGMGEEFDLCVLGFFDGVAVGDAVGAVRYLEVMAGRFPMVDVYTFCHRGAHLVGERWAAVPGSDVPSDLLVLAPVGVVCNGGFMHGMQIGWSRSADHASAGSMAAACLGVQGRAEGVSEDPAGLCADGFGHALWLLSGRSMPAALDGCDLLMPSVGLVGMCYLGVGMQLEEEAVESGFVWGEHVEALRILPEVCSSRTDGREHRCALLAGLVFGVPAAVQLGYPAALVAVAPRDDLASEPFGWCSDLVDAQSCVDELVLRMSQRLDMVPGLLEGWCAPAPERCVVRFPSG